LICSLESTAGAIAAFQNQTSKPIFCRRKAHVSPVIPAPRTTTSGPDFVGLSSAVQRHATFPVHKVEDQQPNSHLVAIFLYEIDQGPALSTGVGQDAMAEIENDPSASLFANACRGFSEIRG
jgi:hypothetical protein